MFEVPLLPAACTVLKAQYQANANVMCTCIYVYMYTYPDTYVDIDLDTHIDLDIDPSGSLSAGEAKPALCARLITRPTPKPPRPPALPSPAAIRRVVIDTI